MGDYDHVTNDMFHSALENIVDGMTGAQILAVPGVYEVLREELNNDVLTTFDTQPDDVWTVVETIHHGQYHNISEHTADSLVDAVRRLVRTSPYTVPDPDHRERVIAKVAGDLHIQGIAEHGWARYAVTARPDDGRTAHDDD